MDSVHAQRVVAEFIPRAVYVQQQFRFRKHRLVVRARNQQGEHRIFGVGGGRLVAPDDRFAAPTVT